MRLTQSWHAPLDVLCIDAYFDGEFAYALSVDDGVFAWNVEYGEPEMIWDTQLDVLSGATERHWLPLQSHIVTIDEPARNTIITARDPFTGRVDWQRNFDARFGSVVEAGYLLYLFCEGFCEILDLRDGSVVQQITLEPFCTRGFRVEDRVFAASESTLIELSLPQDSKALVLSRYEGRLRGLYASRSGLVALDGEDTLRGRIHDSEHWWEFEAPSRSLNIDGSTFDEPAELGYPIIDDANSDALICDLNATLHCVDLVLGTHLWTFEGGDAPEAAVAGTPCVVGGAVIFPCADAHIYVVEHDSGMGLSSIEVPDCIEGRVIAHETTVVAPLDGLRAFEFTTS